MLKFLKEMPDWLVGILGALAIIFVMSVAQHADAKTVLENKGGGFEFYKDYKNKTWYIKNGQAYADLDVTFDSIRVHWVGRFKDQPVVLVSGTSGKLCPMEFRLILVRKDGTISGAKDFQTCLAKNIRVAVTSDSVNVTFDGKTKKVSMH